MCVCVWLCVDTALTGTITQWTISGLLTHISLDQARDLNTPAKTEQYWQKRVRVRVRVRVGCMYTFTVLISQWGINVNSH